MVREVLGFGINSFVNYMEGKKAFIDIPLTQWIKGVAETGSNYWSYEQDLEDKLDHTIYAMNKIKGYSTPFGKIVGDDMEEKMQDLIEARDSGNNEKAIEVFKKNIEDRKDILEDQGYDKDDEIEGMEYRKELAKIEKDEESLKEFISYSTIAGALTQYFDKGNNFSETMKFLSGESDAWDYGLNAKKSAKDLYPNENKIYKWYYGEDYEIKEKKSEEEEEAIEEEKESWKDEFR